MMSELSGIIRYIPDNSHEWAIAINSSKLGVAPRLRPIIGWATIATSPINDNAGSLQPLWLDHGQPTLYPAEDEYTDTIKLVNESTWRSLVLNQQ